MVWDAAGLAGEETWLEKEGGIGQEWRLILGSGLGDGLCSGAFGESWKWGSVDIQLGVCRLDRLKQSVGVRGNSVAVFPTHPFMTY